MDLPPSGMDGQIVVNPNNQWYDQATRSKKVSLAAIVFHELAEAFFKVQFRIPRDGEDGRQGAHLWALNWELSLINGRKDFTAYPGGGEVWRLEKKK